MMDVGRLLRTDTFGSLIRFGLGGVLSAGTTIGTTALLHEVFGVTESLAAAAGFMNRDPAIGEQFVGGQHVRAPAVAFHSKGQHMRMLHEQEHVVDMSRATLLDQLTLKRQRLTVRDQAETADN